MRWVHWQAPRREGSEIAPKVDQERFFEPFFFCCGGFGSQKFTFFLQCILTLHRVFDTISMYYHKYMGEVCPFARSRLCASRRLPKKGEKDEAAR